MSTSVTCFVSFCEADGNTEEIDILLDEIQAHCKRPIKFMISSKLAPGASIDEHEKLLETADAMLLLGTAEYKHRVDARELRTGVAREFQAYLRRKDAYASSPTVPPLSLIPVVWRGTVPTAIPSALENRLVAIDLSRFLTYSVPEGGRRLSTDSRGQVADGLKRIATRLQALCDSKSDEEARVDAYGELDIAYFKEQKREREQFPRFQDEFFVKTRQFVRVSNQEEYLLVGRKGVGKTTLIQSLDADRRLPKHVELLVDEWDVHGVALNAYRTVVRGDFAYLQKNRYEAFSMLWAAFIYLELLRSSLPPAFEKDPQLDLRPEVIKHIRPEATADRAPEFTATSDIVANFMEEMIAAAPSETRAQFDAFLQKYIHIDQLLDWLAGGTRSFHRTVELISIERQMLSLDGFDSKFQRARDEARNSGREAREQVIQTEIDWLTAFVEVIEDIKRPSNRPKRRKLAAFKNLHVVAALPKDRFIEVQQRRDSVLAASTREFRWTGIELINLLRKRIEAAGKFDTRILKSTGVTLPARLSAALERYVPELNQTLSVTVSGRTFEYDLFLEVLRHTLWRPRDVLIHYAELLAVIRDNRRVKRKTSSAVLSIVIARTNGLIIEHEWLREMESITNLGEIMRAFQNGPQILQYDDVVAILKPVIFNFMHRSEELPIEEKIALLYELGFFGLRRLAESNGGRRRMRDVFYHLYPEPIDFKASHVRDSHLVAIHPMFIERLSMSQ